MLSHSSIPGRQEPGPNRQEASDIAVAALLDMAQDTEIIGRFMAQTGVAPADLKALAANPAFLAAVLEFACANDTFLLAFCANQQLAPERVDSARKALAGPEAEWSP